MASRRIALIGTGQMATALARGLVAGQFCEAGDIRGYDPAAAAREAFAKAVPGAVLVDSGHEAAAGADVVVLAVKPQHLASVAESIGESVSARQLLVSIAAGTPIVKLSEWFGTQRVVRVMPNTPCLVGQGASGYALGPLATPADGELVAEMMSSVGLAVRVDEPQLDCVTGLSGSGPAYVYMFIEALADGGVRMGLPRQTALALAAQTVRGAAEMVIRQAEHPAVLKDQVTSPGGTTIAGLQTLENRGMRAAAIAAVESATNRAGELGRSG